MAKKAKKKRKQTNRRAIDDTKKKSKAAARPVKKKTYTNLEYMEMSRSKLEKILTLRQRKFAVLYCSTAEFFCNGVTSYAEAYGVKLSKRGAAAVCASGAYENLRKPQILAYMDKLLEGGGLNDAFADKQLLFMMSQCVDFKTKLGAYNAYNQLRSRIIQKVQNLPVPVTFEETKNYGSSRPEKSARNG